jgi:hypothetical protein
MSCCGREHQPTGPVISSTAARQSRALERSFAVTFEYVGASALTVVGPVSGRRYRFEHGGAPVTIDPRDRPALARVPRLRQVMSLTGGSVHGQKID